MSNNKKCAIVLAAGEGKRMKSSAPKVMSLVAGTPMISWVIKWIMKFDIDDICVVAGYKKEILEQYLKDNYSGIKVCYQNERKGTAHAVMMAKEFLCDHTDSDVLVLSGDAPFVDIDTITSAYELHVRNKNSATVISAKIDNPYGYGRIIRDEFTNNMVKIVEEKDATEQEKKVTEVNSAAFWFNVNDLLYVLDDIKNDNAQGEYYLPDAIKLLISRGKNVDASISKSQYTVLGANDKEQLKQLDKIAIENYQV